MNRLVVAGLIVTLLLLLAAVWASGLALWGQLILSAVLTLVGAAFIAGETKEP